MRVGDLPMPEEFGFVDEIARSNRDVVLPENMVSQSDDSAQKRDCLTRRARLGKNSRVRRDSHESAFRQGAGGPTRLVVLLEPAQRSPVMDMIRPCESDQKIDVQKGNHESLLVQRVLDVFECDRGSIAPDFENGKSRACLRLTSRSKPIS